MYLIKKYRENYPYKDLDFLAIIRRRGRANQPYAGITLRVQAVVHGPDNVRHDTPTFKKS